MSRVMSQPGWTAKSDDESFEGISANEMIDEEPPAYTTIYDPRKPFVSHRAPDERQRGVGSLHPPKGKHSKQGLWKAQLPFDMRPANRR